MNGALTSAPIAPMINATRNPRKPKTIRPSTTATPTTASASVTTGSTPVSGTSPKRVGRNAASATITDTVNAELVTFFQ